MRFFLILLSLLFVSPAFAQTTGGDVNLPADLRDHVDLAAIQAEIATYRQENPTVFDDVEAIVKTIPSLDRQKRGPFAVVGPMFESLGQDALLPMLALLILDQPIEGATSQSARVALRVGLLDAAGKLRDQRALPVYLHVLQSGDSQRHIVRSAVGAIARLSSDEASDILVRLSSSDDPRRADIVAALGHCRRESMVLHLVNLLDDRQSDIRLSAARALGDAANSLAWRTPIVRASGEHQVVRDHALQGLLDAFVAQPELREELTKSILLVDHPETLAQIQSRVASANEGQARALERLAGRVERNPLHRAR